jgi:hypothetical protein
MCKTRFYASKKKTRMQYEKKGVKVFMNSVILVAVPHLSVGSTCLDSPYGCCNDNVTISSSADRRGCPGMRIYI